MTISVFRRDLLSLMAGTSAFAALVGRSALAQNFGPSPIKIATIGAGREGGALGTLFAKLGHPVMFSSRHPEELKDLVAAAGPTARAGTVAEAIGFGDAIFLVVPFPAEEQIGREFGAALAAKPLILDVSNTIPARDGQDFVKRVNDAGGAGLFTAKLLKGARIVRGFNALDHSPVLLAHPPSPPVAVPIAGDDPSAIALASRLIREAGFEPVLVGGLAKGKSLVPGAPLAGIHTPAELRRIAASLD